MFVPAPLGRESRTAAAQTSPADGRVLYMRDCAFCHGPRGEGTQGIPPLAGTGAASTDFYLTTGRMPVASRDIAEAERRDPVYTPPEIERIVSYVASLSPGPPIPVVDPSGGDLGRGADLYLRNCAACHSATGIGAALTSGLVAPSVLSSTPTQVAEAMQIGPGTMPVLSPPLDTDDVDSIARYVTYLQGPQDPGGNPLGHIGPIAEGFVGLAFGLGLILLVTRWIGERG
jgi:ubiquinol-cytochrome c reductase cytochrome c subunit